MTISPGYHFYHIDAAGTEYALVDDVNTWLQDYVGLGMMRLEVPQQRLPYQHGVVTTGAPYLPAREVGLGIGIKDMSYAEWMIRDKALRSNCSPFKSPDKLCILKVVDPSGNIYYLNAWLIEYTADQEDMEGPVWGVRTLVYFAPDPAFYDPTATVTDVFGWTIPPPDITPGMYFPGFGATPSVLGLIFPLAFSYQYQTFAPGGGIIMPLAFDEQTRLRDLGIMLSIDAWLVAKGLCFSTEQPMVVRGLTFSLAFSATFSVSGGVALPGYKVTFPVTWEESYYMGGPGPGDPLAFPIAWPTVPYQDSIIWPMGDPIAVPIPEYLGVCWPLETEGVISGLIFPFIFEAGFGDIGIVYTQTVAYAGTLPTWPVARCYGPGGYPRAENVTANKFVAVLLPMETNDYIDIDMEAGSATFYDASTNTSTDVTSSIHEDSQFWQLSPGSNSIRTTFIGRSSGGARLTYCNRYISV